MKRLITLAAVALLLVAPAASQAAIINFTTFINGAQEASPTPSPAIGAGVFQYDTTTQNLSYQITITDVLLFAPESAAHIHGPAGLGVPAPVIFPLPLGANKVGSVGPLTPAQVTDLFADLWYVNVHTSAYPQGEIRGQINRLVPEPSTFVLAGLGLAGAALAARRRKLA
jgi:CHRD domain/PEP-CTERM motif